MQIPRHGLASCRRFGMTESRLGVTVILKLDTSVVNLKFARQIASFRAEPICHSRASVLSGARGISKSKARTQDPSRQPRASDKQRYISPNLLCSELQTQDNSDNSTAEYVLQDYLLTAPGNVQVID